MKLLIMLLLSHSVFATKYYVANSGSNSANGLTTGTAWQTVSKVNGFTFSSGDSILFNKGDVWNEQLLPPRSNIYFGSYGSGNKPVITGFQTLSMNSLDSNLFSATATNSVKYQNTVLVNGVISGKGRHPNSTLLQTTGPSTTTAITTGLTGTPNYTGGEIVIGPVSWITEVSRIASQSGGTLNLVQPTTYAAAGPNRYFIQNLPSLCDVQNEWAYDSTTKLLTVYSTTAPTVQISTIDTLINVYKKNYITFDGLNITGANNVGIFKDSSNHVTIQNCTFNYIGGHNPFPVTLSGLGGAAITGSNAKFSVIKNDSILNSLNNGVFDIHGSSRDSVYNNFFKNTAIIPGLAAGSNGASIAVYVSGDSSYIYNNRIDSTGYNAIYFNGINSLIKYNYITNFCYTKSDGGGIYCFTTGSQGSQIISNICVGGLGGVAGNVNLTPGTYLDGAHGITVEYNTTDSCYLRSLLLNISSQDNTVRFNTVRNNGSAHGIYFDDTRANTKVTNNIFYSTDSLKGVVFVNSLQASGTTLDSNYYLRPIKEGAKLWRGVNNQYSLSEWITYWAAYSFDVHSQSTPTGITSAAGVLHINPTLSPVTKYFEGLYIDAKGVQHNGSMVLQPYESAILFKATTELPTQGGRRIGNLIFN